MKDNEALDVVRDALARIAPDVELDEMGPDAEFQADLDLDSMDFLNRVAAVHRMTGVDIPERDYAEIVTARALSHYIAARAA